MAGWLYNRRRLATPPIADRKTFVDPTGAAAVTLEHTGSSEEYILRAVGEFDIDTVSCLYSALREIPQTPSGRTIIDVSEVAFGDSAFLHALIRAHFQPPILIIAGSLPSELRRLFQLTGTLRMFNISPHEAAETG